LRRRCPGVEITLSRTALHMAEAQQIFSLAGGQSRRWRAWATARRAVPGAACAGSLKRVNAVVAVAARSRRRCALRLRGSKKHCGRYSTRMRTKIRPIVLGKKALRRYPPEDVRDRLRCPRLTDAQIWVQQGRRSLELVRCSVLFHGSSSGRSCASRGCPLRHGGGLREGGER